MIESLTPLLELLFLRAGLLLGCFWLVYLFIPIHPRARVMSCRAVAVVLALLPWLAFLPVPKVATVLVPTSALPSAYPPAEPEGPVNGALPVTSANGLPEPAPVVESATAPVHSFKLSEIPLTQIVTILWLAGTGLLLVRWGISLMMVRRLTTASDAPPEWVSEARTRLCTYLGVRVAVRVGVIDEVCSPLLSGPRPTILLPGHLVKDDARPDIEAALAHELIHVRERDWYWSQSVHLVSVMLWPLPLVWLLRRAHDASTELVCDWEASPAVGGARIYARSLARQTLHALGHARLATVPMVGQSGIRQRIDLLLAERVLPELSWRVIAGASLAVLTGVAFLKGIHLVAASDLALDGPPQTSYPLHISMPVPGAQMILESTARYDSSSPDINLVRVFGKFVGDYPFKFYHTTVTVSDTPDGPASGGMQWAFGMGRQPGDSPDTTRFGLEIKNPPATSPILYWHLYFEKLEGQKRTLERVVSWSAPNPTRYEARGLQGAPLPQSWDAGDGSFKVTLQSLETGINAVKTRLPNLPPLWESIATFRVEENGQPSDRWELPDVWITPNKGIKSATNYSIGPIDKGIVQVPIAWTLWKKDGPFEIKAAFYRDTDFSPDELYQLDDVPLPQEGEILPLNKDWDAFGTNVHFIGAYGRGAAMPPGLYDAKATWPCLVFTVTGPATNWVKLLEEKFPGGDSKGDQLGHYRPRSGTQIFQINFSGTATEGLAGFTFALLHDRKEVSFVAEPTRP